MAIKTSKINQLFYYLILLGFSGALVACSDNQPPQVQNNEATLTPTVEETAFVSPISPVSPIIVATATPPPSPTPKVTVVIEINPAATLAGEVNFDGKKIYYITTPVYDPLVLTGLAADDQHLWLVNNQTNSIFSLDPKTGETGSVFPFPPALGQDPNILGLTWDGENFWLADTSTKTIYQYDATFKNQLNSFTVTSYPGNIAWDGRSLWLVSREKPELQNWSTDGKLLQTITVPGTEITGLAWGADRLWYVDAVEKVVRYWDPASSSGKVIITDALALQSFGSLSWKGNSLLLLDDMGGRLLSFDVDEFHFIK